MIKTKIRKILVPLDGSKSSFNGLDEAIYIARQCGSTITGLHVVSIYPRNLGDLFNPLKARLLEDARKFMDKASIKTIHNPKSKRNHYEVMVRIITPYQSHNYEELGWDLSKVFNTLGSRIARNLSKRSKKRWKTSIRKIDKQDIF